MLADRYGLSLSTSSQVARDAYVEGADCILAAVADPEAHLGRALDADPDFALARIALARAMFLTAQVPQARQAAARARELATRATPREQSHVDAIALAIEGKAPDALAATRRHVVQFPRAGSSRRWPRRSGLLPEATGTVRLRCLSRRYRRRCASGAVARSVISSSLRWWPRISGRAEPKRRAK